MDYKKIDERLANIENLLSREKTVLTLNELSNYCGLSKSYLYKLTSSKSVPFYKPNGKNIYFEKSEIDHWLLRNKIKTINEIDSEASTYVSLNQKGGIK